MSNELIVTQDVTNVKRVKLPYRVLTPKHAKAAAVAAFGPWHGAVTVIDPISGRMYRITSRGHIHEKK